jgi:membrane protein
MRARLLFTRLREAVDLWLARNAFQFAGALAFYTLFSLAPLVIILVAIAGAVFGEEAARGEISSQIEGLIGTQAAEAVEEAVRSSRSRKLACCQRCWAQSCSSSAPRRCSRRCRSR